MEDSQTRSSPDPPSDSTKKKKSKKHKDMDDLGHEEEVEEDGGAAPVEGSPKKKKKKEKKRSKKHEASDSASDSDSTKKKKKKKKHKDVDDLGHEEEVEEDGGGAPVEGSPKKKKKHSKKHEASDSASESDSTKKKKKSKKHKDVDDLGHEEEVEEDGGAAPVEGSPKKKKKKHSKKHEASDSASDSDSIKKKKKKKSKKHKDVDDLDHEEKVEDGGAVPVEGSPKKKKKKHSKKHEASDSDSDSTKKKKKSKKRKAPDSASDSDSDSIKKKKKHSKRHKTIKDLSQEVEAVATPQPINVTVDASTKKWEHSNKPKAVNDHGVATPDSINVTVDASLVDGSSTGAPVVAYFPTGYSPLAGGREAPNVRLFRNTKHPSRIDLMVRSPGGGPDFVGRSYTGEAALPQLCNYALGVLDKASGTLKVVPIASDKILRLEPYLEVQNPSHSQHSGVTSEAGSAVAAGEMKVQDLTIMYGAKKDRDQDKKWKSLNEQTNDPSAYVDLDLGNSETNVNTSNNEPVIVQNIPPYDPTADTSETAYRFDEIIPKSIRSHLLEILGHLESGEFSSKGYGSFVSNRVQKLEKLQGEEKDMLALILSYITHLLSFLERSGSMSKRHRGDKQSIKAPVVPPAVYRHMVVMFTDEGSSVLSTEKKELLINYILVLTLFADDFRTDPADILADLKMTSSMLRPYYDQLGCKAVSTGAFKSKVMTLPAPLKFPKDIARRKRRGK